jgi:hypothetical protein
VTGTLARKLIPQSAAIKNKFSEQRQEFLSLYPNRLRHIQKKSDKGWITVKGPLFTGLIDAAIAGESSTFYGAHWAAQTRFAVLDIDALSQYRTQEKLVRLLAAVENVGLRANVYQSSDSGGWHLYIPLAGWQNSSEVDQTFKCWLKSLGYEIRGGQLEVFPSGNGLRLPLQPGFAWLSQNGSLVRKREELTVNEAIAYFLEDLEANAQNWQFAKNLMDSQVSAADRAAGSDAQAHQKRLETGGFDDLFDRTNYTIIPEYCEKARQYLASGLTKEGTRHEALFTIQHLLWHGDRWLGIPRLPGRKNTARRYEFLRNWIEQNHNGKCSHINQGDWRTIEAHISRLVNWQRSDLPKLSNYEAYKRTERAEERQFELFMTTGHIWDMNGFERANDKREEEARAKIKQAVSDCLQDGRRISRRRLQAITGCSPNTIRKHDDLWRGLSNGSGVLIRGGTGGLAAIPCSEVEEKNGSSDFEIESFSGAGCVLDSLRYDRTGQTARNSRQVTEEVLAAVHPIQSNSGVKHELQRFAPRSLVAAGGMDCGINGASPEGTPPFNPRPIFSIGAPAPNLRQVGNRCDGLADKPRTPEHSGIWLNDFLPVLEVDKLKMPLLSLERAFGYVPLSCYDKRRQRAGGRLLGSNGYIACRSGGKAMGNEANEKHEQLNRPTERQTDYEKRAQGEVNANVSDYTEKVMATRLEKKLSGNSGVTGQLPDKNGKGLASAKDLLGDDAHGLSKKEKNAALLAQVEKDGYIVGKPKLEQSATPDYQVAQNFDFGKQIQEKMQDAERTVWPHRGHEDRYLDYQACKQAFTQAYLDKFPGVTPELIAGAMRNEQSFYKNTDAAQDKQVREKGTVLNANGQEDDTASIGPAQMQIRKIRGLVNMETSDHKPKYPFLSTLKDDPVTKALEPKNAALLTAAYFAESAEALTKMKIPINNETLAYTWNPDVFKADGKYECPNAVQLKAEHQLPKQLRPHRESVWNPYNEDILKASTHVHNVNEQVRIIRERHLMGN